MKSNNSKQKNRQTKAGPAYLAARAAEAEKQADVARELARFAKAKYKDARKAYKQARKFAKQTRKEAKAAAKALKARRTRVRKAPKKRALTPAASKPVPRRVAVPTPPKPAKRTKPLVPAATAFRDAVPSQPEAGSDIAQA